MKSIILFLMLLGIVITSSGQVRQINNKIQIGEKGKFNKDYKSKTHDFIPPEVSETKEVQRQALDKKEEVARPFKIAKAVKASIEIHKMFDWIIVDGIAFGKVTLRAKKAKTLSLYLANFFLPEGTKLELYGDNGTMQTEVTSNENNVRNKWGTPIYPGETITFEIQIQYNQIPKLKLQLQSFAYGVVDIYGYGESSPCNINVLCAGITWEKERNSVALILADDGETVRATGALVTNTCNLNIPYFLTANHAITDQDISEWRFVFQYWSPNCSTTSDDASNLVFNGATLRANHASSDFALLELFQVPAVNSGLAYSGWSRATSSSNAVVLHHPRGDVMKVSIDANATTTGSFLGILCHRLDLDQGIVEDGSSGAPYYDAAHRIIGNHYGRVVTSNDNCEVLNAFGGRFTTSWTGGGTNSTRLWNWLDPSGSDASSTNSVWVADMVTPSTFQISGANNICSTGNLTLNVPGSASVIWESSNNSIATVEGSGGSATVIRLADGSVTITATITICGFTYIVTREINIGVPVIGYVSFITPSESEGYWCSNAYGNTFYTSPILTGVTYEASLYSWPSMTLVQTAVNPSPGSDPFGYISAGWYVVKIRATNACGASNWYETEVEYVDCGSFRMTQNFAITVSPNPSSNDFNIFIDKETPPVTKLSKNEKVKVSLFEKDGVSQVKSWEFDNTKNQYKLDIRGMKAGTYILTVQKGGYKEAKQVIIK